LFSCLYPWTRADGRTARTGGRRAGAAPAGRGYTLLHYWNRALNLLVPRRLAVACCQHFSSVYLGIAEALRFHLTLLLPSCLSLSSPVLSSLSCLCVATMTRPVNGRRGSPLSLRRAGSPASGGVAAVAAGRLGGAVLAAAAHRRRWNAHAHAAAFWPEHPSCLSSCHDAARAAAWYAAHRTKEGQAATLSWRADSNARLHLLNASNDGCCATDEGVSDICPFVLLYARYRGRNNMDGVNAGGWWAP